MEDGAICSITVCNKDGLHELSGRVFVDATGDGDLAAWSGETMTKGRPEDGAAQPMTMNVKYCGVDTERLKSYVLAHPERFFDVGIAEGHAVAMAAGAAHGAVPGHGTGRSGGL